MESHRRRNVRCLVVYKIQSWKQSKCPQQEPRSRTAGEFLRQNTGSSTFSAGESYRLQGFNTDEISDPQLRAEHSVEG